MTDGNCASRFNRGERVFGAFNSFRIPNLSRMHGMLHTSNRGIRKDVVPRMEIVGKLVRSK